MKMPVPVLAKMLMHLSPWTKGGEFMMGIFVISLHRPDYFFHRVRPY
jgi:hypothetical protein